MDGKRKAIRLSAFRFQESFLIKQLLLRVHHKQEEHEEEESEMSEKNTYLIEHEKQANRLAAQYVLLPCLVLLSTTI